MMSKLCAKCGKPVYFAERKTSLGKEWHPSCLRCTECGKVLSPGQHAEHKGLPYCHNPCYRALFGPSILGYGSNISSPANFARRDRPASAGHGYENENGFKKEIFTYRQRSYSTNGAQRGQSATGPSSCEKGQSITYYGTNSCETEQPFAEMGTSSCETDQPNTYVGTSSCEDQSVKEPQSLSSLSPKKTGLSQKLQEMLQKVQEFNKFYVGKVHNQMTAEEMDDGSIHVQGPIRIYWGLSRPIQLVHCDNIPPAPISQWRHSLCVGPDSPDIPDKRMSNTLSFRRSGSPSRKSKDLDDLLLSPSSPDDVVRRKKKGVRKFKTVAYRGDQPTKWKRASINGHIFNFDTSVFTPVLGSCTSVTVDGTYNAADVIETLLDKFKVQNSPEEYVLSVVSEEGERLLSSTDKPLLERLKLGPDESIGKIFIKERQPEPEAVQQNSSITMPIVETAEEENLPHEVEQLLVLPEAVLRGILAKFCRDEETEIRLVKARYESAKRKIQRRLHEMQTNQASSTA